MLWHTNIKQELITFHRGTDLLDQTNSTSTKFVHSCAKLNKVEESLNKLGLSYAKLRANLACLGMVRYRFASFDLFTYKFK